ncbi:YcxB family protein [Prosthecobacter dejongeii]|uniref:YcxB-like C-terminal domain-containing protein n=1 Tax=Prosthecobacter dejongeii TaxID=48465 RepID=A0A7W8DNU6_9BACT|nr:YcxB family protein [Prosthecobacter dejongeii]MBB5036662.1 hypothetical protein [Prosthecobacter dejongeii]
MNEEITGSYVIDTASFKAAFKWHLHRLTRWKWLALIVLVFCISMGTVASSDLQGNKAIGMAVVMFVLVTLGCIIWYALMIGTFRFMLKQQIKRIPAYGMTLRYVMTEDGLRSTAGGAESFLPWNLVIKSIATPDGVLVYPQQNLFNWLPKTAFTSEADYARFLQLITSKTQHSKVGLN